MRNSGKNGLWKKIGLGIMDIVFSTYMVGCDIFNYVVDNPDMIGPAIEYHGENPIRRPKDTENPDLRPYTFVFDDREGEIRDYEIVFPNFDRDGDGREEVGKGKVLISAKDSSENYNSRKIDMEVF